MSKCRSNRLGKHSKTASDPGEVIPEKTEILKESLEETPAESRTAGSDLLVFAEVLDQHRQWVESGGNAGARGDFAGADLAGADLTGVNLQGAQLQKVNLRGADLSMANLRGANLVEADLREANLLGAEFSGANMMGANLYGAQGLWSGVWVERTCSTRRCRRRFPRTTAAKRLPKRRSRRAGFTYW